MANDGTHTGTISHGTMRIQDLFPAFMAVLEEHAPEEHKRIDREVVEAFGSSYVHFTSESVIWCTDLMSWLLHEDIWDAMQEIAPDRHYFGASYGDGADYGFWQVCDDCEQFDTCEGDCPYVV